LKRKHDKLLSKLCRFNCNLRHYTAGPTAALTARGFGPRVAATVVACVAGLAAPLVLTWQQVVAVASWAIGLGSLLVVGRCRLTPGFCS